VSFASNDTIPEDTYDKVISFVDKRNNKHNAGRMSKRTSTKLQSKVSSPVVTQLCWPNQKKLCGKKDCTTCFARSFAGHAPERAACWSKENPVEPWAVKYGTHDQYKFMCDECHHTITKRLYSVTGKNGQSRWCIYCAGKALCDDELCDFCYQRSFAAHKKSKFWSDNNNEWPREVAKCSGKLFWFKCPNCKHEFDMNLHNIVCNGSWCRYCAGKYLCDDNNCKLCLDRSFASHEKSNCWSKKNKVRPRDVCKSSHKKYWFDCDNCEKNFKTKLNGVANGQWCPVCRQSKGEKAVAEALTKRHIPFKRQKTFPKLRHKKLLQYDFYFEYKGQPCVIEYDGVQHFNPECYLARRVNFEERKEIDLKKTRFAVTNGIVICRIPYIFLDNVDACVALLLRSLSDDTTVTMFIYNDYQDERLYKEHVNLVRSLLL
jgi:hypothetical protein